MDGINELQHGQVTTVERRVLAWLTVGIVLSISLAGLLAVAVPAGQPYDEPSHWDTVQFYADEHRLPRLGEPGVTYEAQMGPAAYTLGALEVAALGDQSGFTAFRWTNALLCGLIVVLTYLLARQLYPDRPWLAVWAGTFTGALPMIVAFSGSVQNDTLAVVLSLAAAVVLIRALGSRDGAPLGLWCSGGLLVALAVLTKVQTIAIVPALLVTWLTMPDGRRKATLRGVCVATAVVAAGTGWWFVRNLVLYGDLTAVDGLEKAGYSFPPRPLDPSNVASLGRAAVSAIWVPTEYYRNAFEAPLVLRALTAILTVLVIVGVAGALLTRSRPGHHGEALAAAASSRSRVAVGRTFVLGWVLVTLVGWAVLVFASSNVSPRVLAVIAAPTVVLLGAPVAETLRRVGGQVLTVGAGVALICFVVVVDAWLAVEVANIASQPFWIDGV